MNKILTPLFKILTLFLLLFIVAHPLFSQHVMVYDSINHKEFIIKKGYKVFIKKKDQAKEIKCKIDRFDNDVIYVHKGNNEGWIQINDIDYLRYKPGQKSAVIVWAISAAIPAVLTIYQWNIVGDGDGSGGSKMLIIMSAPIFIGLLPVLVSESYKAVLPQKTFVIGKGSSIQYFPK